MVEFICMCVWEREREEERVRRGGEEDKGYVCIQCVCVSRRLANLNRIRGSTDGLFSVNYTVL